MKYFKKYVTLATCIVILMFTVYKRGIAKETKYGTNYSVSPEWQLGIALYTFHTYSFPEQLELARQAGVKNVEGFTFAGTGKDFKDSMLSQLSDVSLLKLKAIAKGKGLNIVSFYIGAGNTVAGWKRQFEIAQLFGAKYVTTEPPKEMWDSIDSLADVFKMKVAIHNHWKGTSDYWTPEAVLEAVKGHPNFGACADIGHWPKSGINPVDGLKKLKGHIVAIHLKDIAAYNNDKLKDVVIGTGVIDMKAVFKTLQRQGFKGYVNIERDVEEQPNNLASVQQGIVYYNNLIQQL